MNRCTHPPRLSNSNTLFKSQAQKPLLFLQKEPQQLIIKVASFVLPNIEQELAEVNMLLFAVLGETEGVCSALLLLKS